MLRPYRPSGSSPIAYDWQISIRDIKTLPRRFDGNVQERRQASCASSFASDPLLVTQPREREQHAFPAESTAILLRARVRIDDNTQPPSYGDFDYGRGGNSQDWNVNHRLRGHKSTVSISSEETMASLHEITRSQR